MQLSGLYLHQPTVVRTARVVAGTEQGILGQELVMGLTWYKAETPAVNPEPVATSLEMTAFRKDSCKWRTLWTSGGVMLEGWLQAARIEAPMGTSQRAATQLQQVHRDKAQGGCCGRRNTTQVKSMSCLQ